MLPLGLLVPGGALVRDELFDNLGERVRDRTRTGFAVLMRIVEASPVEGWSAIGDGWTAIRFVKLRRSRRWP